MSAARVPLILAHEALRRLARIAGRREGRPAADVARAAELWVAIRDVDARFDAANPLPPCPTCGRERLASFGGGCLAFGECPRAPRVMGG